MAFINVPDEALPTVSPSAVQFMTEPATVDLNTDDNQVVWTNPASSGRIFRVTQILFYNPSVNLDTWYGSMGITGTAYTDILANATHTGLNAATVYKVLSPVAAGCTEIPAGTTVYLKNNTKQGSAATMQVRLVGWLETA